MFKSKMYYYLKILAITAIFTYSGIQPALAHDELNFTPSQIQVISSKTVKHQYGSIPTLILSGTPTQMGIQYGTTLKSQLSKALSILEDFYITQNKLTYAQLVTQANLLYNRFPLNYQLFIQGEAVGSGLSLSDVKILNAMETLGQLLPHKTQTECAFLFLSPKQTSTGASLIGRNYDYPAPFDQLAEYLTVTVMKQPNKVPTAFISIAGEIYCPSCVNAKGLFMELNNGTPSGGNKINTNTQSMLATMLATLQNSNTIADVQSQLSSFNSDFSLIVNAANSTTPLSFEYSTNPSLGMNYYYPDANKTFAVTNFFLNPVWSNRIPAPTDDTTWYGVTRRNNLLNLALQNDKFDINSFQTLMNTTIPNGGAVWNFTIYQLIFDSKNMDLYVRILSNPSVWNKIPLGKLFN